MKDERKTLDIDAFMDKFSDKYDTTMRKLASGEEDPEKDDTDNNKNKNNN